MNLLHIFELNYPATFSECREVQQEMQRALTHCGRSDDKVLIVAHMKHAASVVMDDAL
jgi:hypothetical protein